MLGFDSILNEVHVYRLERIKGWEILWTKEKMPVHLAIAWREVDVPKLYKKIKDEEEELFRLQEIHRSKARKAERKRLRDGGLGHLIKSIIPDDSGDEDRESRERSGEA